MKKFTIFFLFFILSINNNAQILNKDDGMVNLGMGMGAYYGNGNGFKIDVPPIYGSYEYMIDDNISVGGFMAYMHASYNLSSIYDPYKISWNYSYFNISALGNYHFYNTDKLNAYGGLKLGYTNITANYGSNDSEVNQILNDYDSESSGILFGFQIGGRYFFTESLAFNMELGYGIALLKGGLTFKF